jgi:hypothetical protein
MYQTIVGDDVGHREHPGVPLFGEHVAAGAGERPVRRHQRVVHAVHPLHQPADAGQVQPRRRGAGEDAGGRAGRDQRARRGRVQLHVGVEVQPGEGAAGRVAQPQRVRLSGYRGLDHPDAVDRPGGFRGTVGARVGDHDDVELAGCRTVEQPSQVVRDDGLLVVCRYDDADSRLAHAAQDNGYRDRGSR